MRTHASRHRDDCVDSSQTQCIQADKRVHVCACHVKDNVISILTRYHVTLVFILKEFDTLYVQATKMFDLNTPGVDQTTKLELQNRTEVNVC